jgi:hypothetical protein
MGDKGSSDSDLLDDGGSDSDLRMSVVFPVNDSIESIVRISGVLYNTPGTIGFDEGVAAVNDVTLAGLGLALDVTGVGVMDGVLELVLGMGIVVVDDLLGDGDGGMGHSDGSMGDGNGAGGVGDGTSGIGYRTSGIGDGTSGVGDGTSGVGQRSGVRPGGCCVTDSVVYSGTSRRHKRCQHYQL